MASPVALAWRLQRPTLAAWTAAVAVLGAVLGSVAHTVAGLLDSPGLAKIIEQLGGAQGLTDAFLAAEVGLAGTIVAAYGIAAAERLRKEESLGHVEVLLSTSVTRRRWAASHWGIALGGVAWLMAVGGASIGAGHAVAIGEPGQIGRLTVAALAQVPAAWVLVGLVVATFGVWPKATAGVWGVYIAFVVVGLFGTLWGLPQLVLDLSPFIHSPLLPGPDPEIAGVVWLVLAAVVLLAVGSTAFRRRDVAA